VKTPGIIRLLILLATVNVLLSASPLSYRVVDYPGASATFANDINGAGQVVGTYRDASGLAHGYILENGTYSSLDFPGSLETFANGINDQGEIVGWNGTASSLYSAGVFTTFNVPGAIRTIALGVNNLGDIVGGFIDASGDHGFLYTGGAFMTIDVPGAVSTGAYGINDAGTIVGNAPFVANGFVLMNGTVDPIPPVPGSLGILSAGDINNSGHVVGSYGYESGGGFLANTGAYLLRNGGFDSVPIPGSPFIRANGLNDIDVVVGDFSDASGRTHGFVTTPEPATWFEVAAALSVICLLRGGRTRQNRRRCGV
jgi:probable HAF family extracellular repeat protein